MRGDEKNRNLRLEIVNVCDHLEAGNVRQKKIDDTESEVPAACLIDSILAFSYKDDLVPVRLEHQPERIANGWLIINDENAEFIFDVGHSWQFYGLLIVTGGTGRSTLMPNFLSLR